MCATRCKALNFSLEFSPCLSPFVLRSFFILPVPPFEQFRIVPGVRSIIHRATKRIQQATVNLCSFPPQRRRIKLLAPLLVHSLGVFVFQLAHGAKSHFPQIFRNAFPYAGDLLQFPHRCFFCDWRLHNWYHWAIVGWN